MIEARTKRLPKRGVFTLCLLLAVGAAGTSAARPPCERHAMPGPGPGPGFLTEHAEELGIDDSIRGEIREIFESSREIAEARHEAVREAHRAMRDLLEGDSPREEAVMQQAERISALELEATKHRLSTMLRVHALLTPEQRAKLAELRAERRDGRRRHRMDWLDESCAGTGDCGQARRGPDGLECRCDGCEEPTPACREMRRHRPQGPRGENFGDTPAPDGL